MHDRIIIHMDLDYFFAQCEEKEHPEIRGRPVVVCVYSGRGDSGAVSTSNYEARRSGIKAGIPISRAKKIDPDAVYLPVNMELYRRISGEVMEILREHCGDIEQESIDEAFCDITGNARDFDEAFEFAKQIKEAIKHKTGLTCSIGVAPNKLVARIASDFRKPDGLTLVNQGEVLEFLTPLKVKDLTGVGKKTEEKLNELGVMTIGDLARVPVEDLVREFGKAKGVWLDQASKGIDDSPVEEREGTGQIGRITTLKEDTNDLEVISGVINDLSNDVCRKLEQRKLSFRSVTFVGIANDFKTRTRTHALNAPSRDVVTLKNTAHELAKLLLSEIPLPLRRAGVRVSNLIEDKGQKTLGDF